MRPEQPPVAASPAQEATPPRESNVSEELDRLVSLASDEERLTEEPFHTYTFKRERIANTKARILAHVASLEQKAAAYDRINTPEIDDFLAAVKNEALHQRERWGIDQDGGKEPSDWFWLVGYLAGKALHDVKGKRLHHLITTGAALLNWHAHAIGAYARTRPGIEPPTTEPT